MSKIRKPKRKGAEIVKGRIDEANPQGKRQENDPRYQRLVSFEKVVGIRRAELKNLRGDDFIENLDRKSYIRVRSVKGEKEQYQFILAKDIDLIREPSKGSA